MRKEDRRSDSLGCQLGWDLSQAWSREMRRGIPRSPQVLLHFLSALFFVSYGIKLLINSLMRSLIQQMLVRCFEAETVHQPHRLCPLYLEGSGLRWGSWLGHRVWGGDTPTTTRRQSSPGKLLSPPPDTRWLLMLGNYCFNH